MTYKHFHQEYYGEPHRQMKQRVNKARKNLAIFCWGLIVFGVGALGFFIWIIITVMRDMR